MRAMPSYSVKEMFLTLQGEGANSGRVAVFVRFSGCNLWTGREADRGRGKGGCSKWCDTDFVGTNGDGGGKFSSCEELAREISKHWGEDRLLDKNKSGASGKYPAPLVVFTGGEPLLQLNEELIVALHKIGFEIAIETNGTIEVPKGVDWVCVSPKAGSELVVKRGQELKLVIPQEGVNPADYLDLDFEHFFVQALDSENAQEDLRAAIDYCHKHPQWRLSLQSHKYMGIP